MLTSKQMDEFLKTLHNPRYVNPDHSGAILLNGIFEGEILPFFASPYDRMKYGRIAYAKAIVGAYGQVREYEELN